MSHSDGYSEDLSFIHDVGFADFAKSATRFLLPLFSSMGLVGSTVVELGCGSGTVARILSEKGFQVRGVDISPAMVDLARQNAPDAFITNGSLWDYPIPPCDVILSIGECLNYTFDGPIPLMRLKELVSHVYQALSPQGIFVFDILCHSKPEKELVRHFVEGDGWLVAIERRDSCDSLTRKIISFKETNSGLFRRSEELHVVHKYHADQVVTALNEVGFKTEVRNSYGQKKLKSGHKVLVAQKRSSVWNQH